MADNILEPFEPLVSKVPSVYELKSNVSSFDLEIRDLDILSNLVKHDFYKLGLTESLNRARMNVDPRGTYFISGKAIFENNKAREAIVNLLTFDYKPVASLQTDKEGNYFFDFLLKQDYIVIAEDFNCEYNHSIQVGVKPSETV